MNIKCNIEKIKSAVSLTDKMCGKNLTLPILSNLLFSIKENKLKIRSTNLNVGIEVTVDVLMKEEGIVSIKGDILSNILNNLPQTQEINLYTENENLILESVKTKNIIKCLPVEDFPLLPIVEGESFDIDNKILQEGIRSVFFASAINDIKPEIASIFIYTENDYIYFVATDSFRLAEKKIKIKGLSEIPKILLPYKNISDILKTLDNMSEKVRIVFNRNQISINDNNIYFTSRLIDGGFPAYQLIIPKEENTKIVVLKQDLINTLRLATVFSDKFFQVVLSINNQDKKVTISSKNNEIGSSITNIDAVITGEDIEVIFNLKYFLDVFQAISGDSISISFTKSNKPILIKNINDNNFLYLLMPTNR